MKFLVIVALFFILFGLVLGQTDPICHIEPILIGGCGDSHVGYTYNPIRNRCINYAVRACSITGNFFKSRKECDAYCKVFNSFSEAPFSYYLDRAFEGVLDFIGGLTRTV